MPSPRVIVEGSGTQQGTDVDAGSLVTIQLADQASVSWWELYCTRTDDEHTPDAIVLSIDQTTLVATFTAPADVCALQFLSIVNRGLDVNEVAQSDYQTTFAVYVPYADTSPVPLRLAFSDETTEGDAAFGWTSKWNNLTRVVGEGGGGATGPIGPQGIQGATGVRGPQGSPGIAGSAGSQGATGVQGIQGPIGATGPAGAGGAPGGASGSLQINAGGVFGGALNVSAGTGFIAVGTGAASTGTIRVGNMDQSLIRARHANGTEHDIVSIASSNARFGQSAAGWSSQFYGSQTEVYAATSLVLEGQGTVEITAGNALNRVLFTNGATGSIPIPMTFGSNVSLTDTVVPSATPTGVSIYSQTGVLKWKNPAGTVFDMSTAGSFSAGGDLTGSTSSQQVVKISGNATGIAQGPVAMTIGTGTTQAATGTIRGSSSFSTWTRNGANSGDYCLHEMNPDTVQLNIGSDRNFAHAVNVLGMYPVSAVYAGVNGITKTRVDANGLAIYDPAAYLQFGYAGGTIATSGKIRMQNNTAINACNASGTADILMLGTNTSNQLVLGGVALGPIPASGLLVGTTDVQTLTNKMLTTPTMVSPTIAGVIVNNATGSNDSWGVVSKETTLRAEITTTNNTVTDAITFTIPTTSINLVDVVVTARKTSGLAVGGSAYKRTALFKNDGGTVTVLLAAQDNLTSEETAGYDCTIDNSTTTGRIRVTGGAADTVIWTVVGRIQKT